MTEAETSADYLFLYRGGAPTQPDLSPEQMQAHLAKWDEWVARLTARGVFAGGQALVGERRMVQPDLTVSDGPFTEAKEIVGGYSLVVAESLDDAAEIAKGCPIFEYGGHVEVRRLADRCNAS